MAPEYAMRGYLTDKADVYSFGIVALEIVSGKSNTSYMPKDEFVSLLDWVTFYFIGLKIFLCFVMLLCRTHKSGICRCLQNHGIIFLLP